MGRLRLFMSADLVRERRNDDPQLIAGALSPRSAEDGRGGLLFDPVKVIPVCVRERGPRA